MMWRTFSNLSRDPKCVFSNSDTKLYLYVIISLVFFVYISALQSCWGQTIINRLYKDEKNFTSVLSFCIGPKCVSSNDDRKALILCELHF